MLHCFLLLFILRLLFMSLFFTKFVKLDPDSHGSAFILPPGSGYAFRKTAGSGSAKNECGSTALIQTSVAALGFLFWRRPVK